MSNAKKPHVDVDAFLWTREQVRERLMKAQTSLDDARATARRLQAVSAFLGHATETGFEVNPEDLGLVGGMLVELAEEVRSDIHDAQEQIRTLRPGIAPAPSGRDRSMTEE